jgi:hypothetical protein
LKSHPDDFGGGGKSSTPTLYMKITWLITTLLISTVNVENGNYLHRQLFFPIEQRERQFTTTLYFAFALGWVCASQRFVVSIWIIWRKTLVSLT